jgi:DNA-binding MarR family transcriptional regulator
VDELDLADYRALHEFRFQIGRFLHFSEEAARAEGLEPRQHQLLLAVRATDGGQPTVGELAARLFIRHHSAVELADRLTERGLAVRVRTGSDRRQVRIRLTELGEETLHRLSGAHRDELRHAGPSLAAALSEVLQRFSPDLNSPHDDSSEQHLSQDHVSQNSDHLI